MYEIKVKWVNQFITKYVYIDIIFIFNLWFFVLIKSSPML